MNKIKFKKSSPCPVEYVATGQIGLPLWEVTVPCVSDAGATSQFY